METKLLKYRRRDYQNIGDETNQKPRNLSRLLEGFGVLM